MKLFYPSEGAHELRAPRGERAYLFAAAACALAVLAAQIALCVRFSGPQLSDALSYLTLAHFCVDEGYWYPAANVTFAPYIYGNGYVNLLALLLRFFPEKLCVCAVNVVCTQIVLLTTADVCFRLTGRRTCACLALCLLCAMGGLWGEAVNARTELPFMALCGLSLSLTLRRAPTAAFFGGAFLALANWVRPLLVVYLPAAMLYFAVTRAGKRRVLAYLAGALALILVIGGFTKKSFGKFLFQAQTMGVNMVMGACDEADGSYVGEILEEGGSAHAPEGMTALEKDAYYKKLAVEWIGAHPARFLSLAPAKLFYFLATDTYGGAPFFNNERQTDTAAYLLELPRVLLGRGERAPETGDLVAVWSQIAYTAVLLLYAARFFRGFFRGFALDSLFLHGIFALACGVTVMTVGGARYHMPYLPIFCIFAAQALECRPRKAT